MKKTFLSLLCLAMSMTAGAQQYMRIWQGGNDTRVALQDITYSADGTTLQVAGQQYNTASVDSITMVHVITVTYQGGQATVDAGKAPGVTYTVEGANVNIVSTNKTQELETVLQGTSTNGSLTYTGPLKCKFYLNGLNLTSTQGAAIDIQCGKRVDLILVDGTQNTVTDAAGGLQKAALYCKGHLEVEGSGNLTVSGNTRHAIASKEYLQLKKSTGTITIAKAAGDAIHVGQYLLMSGGTINIDENTAGDGIQVETMLLDDKLTPDPSKEENGKIFIKGGTINAVIAHEDYKGIKNDEGDVTISGGNIRILANGNGSRGIQTDGNMTVSAADGETTIYIEANGARCTDINDSVDPHRAMGIKVEKNLTMMGGTTTVKNTGSKARGIKVNGTYTYKGGTVDAQVVATTTAN